MERNLLFVTSPDDISEDGLSYALYLAEITRKGISVLMVHKKKFSERFEDLMTAVTFAEANEHETAREILKNSASKDAEGKKLQDIQEKCKESGIAANIYTATEDIPSALKGLLKKDKNIDMVLLSPEVTHKGNLTIRDLKKLLKTVSIPIVTLTRQNKSHSNKSVEVA
ncbi:MAG: hypothetical protein HY752_05895 [Nitrospirae bacterium]|nr:hypothetical protein [Nitrospirota bacterium]